MRDHRTVTMIAIGLLLLVLGACNERAPTHLSLTETAGSNSVSAEAISPTAADILFVVLGKMSLYNQSSSGEITLRNHHFVAELMPKFGRKIISGRLTSAADATRVIEFNAEGNAFLAHGARVSDPSMLHKIHPDGSYVFSYETQSGRMNSQVVELRKRPAIEEMPPPMRVSSFQDGQVLSESTIDPDRDLALAWESMPGNKKSTDSELDDLIFVLAFDCFGNNVSHSGRPYQGGPYLTYADSNYVIPATALNPGLDYTVIVEQATADVRTTLGVPAIATYATLTFLKFRTTGNPARTSCPNDVR